MTTRKILIVTYEEFPSFIGLSTRVLGLAMALKARNWDVAVAAPFYGNRRVAISNCEGIPVHRLGAPDILKLIKIPILGRVCFTLVYSLAIVNYFRGKSHRFDYIQSEQIFCLFGSFLLSRIKKAGLIFDDPSMMGLFVGEKIGSKLLGDTVGRMVELFERFSASLPDYIFCSSPRTRERYRLLRPLRHRYIAYLPNGVSINKSASLQPPRFGNTLFFNCSLPYYQNMAALKNIVRILSLLNNHGIRDYRCKIVVNDSSLIPEYMRNRLFFNRNVEISDPVPDIEKELESADFIMLPYEKGHFSTGGTRLKALEALKSGRLVLSTAEGMDGIEDLRDNHHFLLCRDSIEMAQRLKLLLLDRNHAMAEIDRIGGNAREFVFSRYAWDVVSSAYEILSV